MNNPRRNLLKGIALTGAALGSNVALSFSGRAYESKLLLLKGHINHSVARWTYGDLSIEDLCKAVNTIGFSAIDLVRQGRKFKRREERAALASEKVSTPARPVVVMTARVREREGAGEPTASSTVSVILHWGRCWSF